MTNTRLANTRLSSHGGHASLPQLDALATLVSTKCLAAFSPLGGSTREVAVDVDALDMACWTELMRLVNDPDTILASSAAKRAVVRLKMADCTRKHIWDTTEKKEKKDTDSLAEHVRHAAPRMDPRSDAPSSPRPQPNPPDPEQVRFVAKPLEIEAKHSDPLRRYLREGVTSREDVPAQFARAWGTRESKLDPLGLVHRLCTPAHLHLADPPPLHRCIPDPPRPCPSGEFARDGEPRQLPAPRRGGDSACDAAGRRLRRRPRCVLLVATLPPPYPHPTPTPTLTPTPNQDAVIASCVQAESMYR